MRWDRALYAFLNIVYSQQLPHSAAQPGPDTWRSHAGSCQAAAGQGPGRSEGGSGGAGRSGAAARTADAESPRAQQHAHSGAGGAFYLRTCNTPQATVMSASQFPVECHYYQLVLDRRSFHRTLGSRQGLSSLHTWL